MTNPQMSKEELKQAKKDAKKLLKKPFYKKWWVWLLAIIILGGIANSGGEESAEETTAPLATETAEATEVTESTPAEETSAEEPEAPKVAGIGETIKVGDVEFTVYGTSTSKNVGGEYGVDAQGTFLILDVEVKNVGNESITTDTSFFKLTAGEKTYDADSSGSIYANEDTNFFLEQVNPDLAAKGNVVFDVSDEVIANTELQLQVSTGFFGTETGDIKISK